MKKVVLDTNVLLVSISSKSPYHWIFKSLLEKKYTLCVSTEILSEYAEILERYFGAETSESVLGALENLSTVEKITTYYRFRLLKDPDDDKFVDCVVAGNADFIVSHDKHFQILKNTKFPSVRVVNSEIFLSELES